MTFNQLILPAIISTRLVLAFLVPCGEALPASGSAPHPATASQFPSVQTSYLDAQDINPQAFSYQLADYDPIRNQAIFYPYGSILSPIANSGVLLLYNAGSNDFANTANWTAVNLSQVVTPDAVNFGGGFLDDSKNFAFLPPGAKVRTSDPTQQALVYSAVAVKVDLAKQHLNPYSAAAYDHIDLRTLPGMQFEHVGGFSGVFANGYAYFAPTVDSSDGVFHGTLIRYNNASSFSNASSWEFFDLNDLVTPADPELGGMQSMAYVAPYVYLIPFEYGKSGQLQQASKIVRYDTTKSFQSKSSYQFFDLTTLPFPSAIKSQMGGFTGGIMVGKSLVLVPWGSRDNQQTNHVAVLYDTTKGLNDPTAWQYIDLTKVNSAAGGYQFGWLDKRGFVWFVPTHNYAATSQGPPPFITWNTALPFAQTTSWNSIPNRVGVWSTGAAYDPATDTAWFAPYGAPSGSLVPLITQLQEH